MVARGGAEPPKPAFQTYHSPNGKHTPVRTLTDVFIDCLRQHKMDGAQELGLHEAQVCSYYEPGLSRHSL